MDIICSIKKSGLRKLLPITQPNLYVGSQTTKRNSIRSPSHQSPQPWVVAATGVVVQQTFLTIYYMQSTLTEY